MAAAAATGDGGAGAGGAGGGMDASKKEISNNVTLTQHVLAEGRKAPQATGELTLLLASIETACKYISSKVRAAGLFHLFGAEGSTNVQGETVKKLDIISNDAFITALKRSTTVRAMVSEENEKMIVVEPEMAGSYVVTFDPLDGSSNIEANVSIGTIFGIYKKAADCSSPVTEADLLLPGTELAAAGYCMYGSATMLVITTGRSVNGFTLDPSTGEFVLSHPAIAIPKSRSIYSVNEGNSKYWYDDVKNYVDAIKKADKPHSLRYVGSMVADVHRTLLYGGIFMYPGDNKSKSGKLRLLYEGNPMSMLCEVAGGAAICGKGQRVLDVVPTSIHQRTPIFLGSKENIEQLESFMKKD